MARRPFVGGSFSFLSPRKLDAACERGGKLSPRERLIIKLVADGFSNKEMSAVLNISVKTTEAHRAAAMRKLGINSVAGLVRYAVRENLIEA
jgi:DNA-binding NarL/FixJ family response regulator